MNEKTMNNETPLNATESMLADLGIDGPEGERLRAVLGEVAGLANEVPEPSADVRAMLNGAIPLRRRRNDLIVAAAVGTLAFGGFSAAAAANRLPDRVQEVVANATESLPVQAPHPVKPVNPPIDAPGHVKDEPKATTTPKPVNTSAPGQIQKLTKPDPKAPGPARPADPGSHGRAHNDGEVPGQDPAKGDKVKADKPESDNDDAGDDTDTGDTAASGSTKVKSK